MATKFNIAKKGYETVEVDEYIDTLENVIKSYKEKDSAIKNAILNAQIAADNIVMNAKNEAAEIKQTALLQMDDLVASIGTQKQLVEEFQKEYNTVIERYLHKVNSNDIQLIFDKINRLENYIQKLTINDDVNQLQSVSVTYEAPNPSKNIENLNRNQIKNVNEEANDSLTPQNPFASL